MNVSQGTEASANRFPQPDLDTQPVTAPGLWTTRQSTRKLLPCPPREYQRQELLRAAEKGHLAIRRVKLSKETLYFRGEGAPRPFTLALQGVPTSRVPVGRGESMIGIVNPHCLYAYKRDADTRDIELGIRPHKLKTKLLPGLRSLKQKCEEEVERAFWEGDPTFTTGHLRKEGLFSLPKLKYGHYVLSLPYPELVTIRYDKADIKCFCVVRDPSTDIADTLQAKRRCERALDLEPLPLVVHCQRTGTVEVYFDDELDHEHLANNERCLDEFALSQNLSPDNLRALLNLLPMPLHAEALSSKLIVPAGGKDKLQQAIQRVSDPRYYSYQGLLELKESGLPIHQRFVHEGNVRSLLDMLLSSEMRRCDQPEQERIQEQEEEAYRLLQLLLQSGARLDERCIELIDRMVIEAEPVMPPDVLNAMVAAFAPFECLTLRHLRRIPLIGCQGSVVEFDRICQEFSQQQEQQQLQNCLKKVLRYVRGFNPPTLDIIRSHLLALFHYGAYLDEHMLAKLKISLERYYRNGKKVIDHFSVADYIQWLEQLWEQRKTYPFYQHWPERVRQAQQDIDVLKQSLGLNNPVSLPTPLAAETPEALQFLVNAFSKPPTLPDHASDNEKTILKVLQHYYRRPGPERVIESLASQTLPAVWKPKHSCSHVLRARNNGHWYMELLEKFQQCSLNPKEKELLALAIIYHDAAAEDVDKSAEETRSAFYFKRDLAGHYPEPLLDDMALAMASKENDVNGGDEQKLPEPVRWYLRILRFADRMDIIRGCGVEADFPRVTETQPRSFDARRLDLPSQLPCDFSSGSGNRTEFQRHLEAAMHGAADLAQVTGRPQDQRKKNYVQAYGLSANGSKISENFERTSEPVQRMNQFIDDNVRRKMAQEAGIIACADPSHRACQADQSEGVTYGIHNNWYDLRQVEVPSGMTLLEKMQYEHDPSLLSPATQQALEREVQRLKREGIRMNPGTLTQKTLASPEAQTVLKKRGIVVVGEKRPYVTSDGDRKEWEMLIPKKVARLEHENNRTDP